MPDWINSIVSELRKRGKELVSLDTPENPDGVTLANDIAVGFTPGLGTVMSLRDYERARRDGDYLGMGLSALGMIPLAGGVTKGIDAMRKGGKAAKAAKTEFEIAHEVAQRNAALPVEKGGLGLPPNNTAMDRAKAQGYVNVYHGTADDVKSIDPKQFGTSTGATSAKKAFWMVDDPNTARGYAEYAATQAPVKRLVDKANVLEKRGDFDGYDDLLRQAEELEMKFTKDGLQGQNIMPLMVRANRGKGVQMDAKGQEFTDIQNSINRFLGGAQKDGADIAVLKNLSDDVGFNGRPANHYAALNPSIVRSRFAAFDPFKKDSTNILAGTAATAITIPALIEALRSQEQPQTQ